MPQVSIVLRCMDGWIVNSRDKGCRGERDAAQALASVGITATRSQQFCGRTGVADLVTDTRLHIEVKFTERLNPYKFLAQAIADARPTKRTPVVLMRSVRADWLVLVLLSDLRALASEVHNRPIPNVQPAD